MKVTLNSVTQSMIAHDQSPRYLTPEEYMIYCSRVSSPDNRLNHDTAPGLLSYLIKHGHWSPFEMISFGFEIVTSRAIAQQLLRHRSFSFQEFSQRYAEVTDVEPTEPRNKAATNRQSSSDLCNNDELNRMVMDHAINSLALYDTLIEVGVAKECARDVLPLSTQTVIVMHGTLRSWIHFFEQRCSVHAQKETRLIANEIRNELSDQCPWTAAALRWGQE